MRRSRAKISLAALAALTALVVRAQSGGTIEGRVANSVTGEGVGGVKVRFLDRRSYVYETVTDSTGSYRLTGLADGEYSGEFTKDGFSDNRGNVSARVLGDVPARADTQLKPWGALRGRVVDEDGKPASGVQVERDPNPRRAFDGDAVTDENGEFVFQDLAPGSYTVVAKPAAKIGMQDGVRVGTVAMYYPSATELAEAAPIAVRTGENVSGIEIRLKSVPVHRVAGVVLGVDGDKAGKPVAHVTVKLLGRASAARQRLGFGMSTVQGRVLAYTTTGPGPEPEIARMESHDDGTFEFPAVEDGDWRLSAAVGVDDDMPLAGVASVLISGKDVEDIQIRLAGPFAVEVNGPLYLAAVEGQPRLNLDPAKNIAKDVAKTGGLFPGRYRVIANTGLDVYPSAVMWGGRDVNGQIVDLTPGAGPFEIVYKSGLGKVRGTVEKGEGGSLFLISKGAGEILTYQQVICGPGGAFEIGPIPPGDYYIVAFDRTETGELPAADLPASIIPVASTVSVASGSTAPVDLGVNKWPW